MTSQTPAQAGGRRPEPGLIELWFDFPDEDRPSFSAFLPAVPRIGESVGIKLHDPPRQDWIKLYPVVEVRHYTEPEPQIRIVLGKP